MTIRYFLDLVETMQDRKSLLEKRWNNPEFLTRYEPLMDDYHCETVAEVVKRLEPNTAIWGFSDDENPGTRHFKGHGEDGHHFAVVEGRFIVDPWMFEPEGKSVWDLDDPADQAEIKRLYGDKNLWTQIDTQRGYTFTRDEDFS